MSKDSWYNGYAYSPYPQPGVDSKEAREKDFSSHTDDSTYTFRVNAELKDTFLRLCKREHYSAAAALKRYMQRCVEKEEVTHDFRRL